MRKVLRIAAKSRRSVKMEKNSDNTTENQTAVPESAPLDLSVVFLIAANAIPLFGSIFWGWRVFDIVVLYWLENVIVGLINAVRMLLIRSKEGRAVEIVGRIFQTGFFLVHFGIFTVVHGVFVLALLGDSFGEARQGVDTFDLFMKLKWAALALVGSHTISFIFNFLGKKEYLKRTLGKQMMAPYPRMIALHMAIVFGAFAVIALGQPVVLLVILVVGKTIVDWKLHVRSHRKLDEKESKYHKLS